MANLKKQKLPNDRQLRPLPGKQVRRKLKFYFLKSETVISLNISQNF